MTNYQGNSDKQKKKDNPTTPEKNLERVVTGQVVVKPPGLGSRFKRIFFGGNLNTAAEFVVADVLLPALRNLVVEAVSKGSDRLVYGDSHRRRGPTGYAPRVNYSSPVYRQEPRSRGYVPGSPGHQVIQKSSDEVYVGTKEEADEIIERMLDMVDQYETASVAELNELIGHPSSHIDQKWGWTNLRSVECRQTREGWKISFPPLEEIS